QLAINMYNYNSIVEGDPDGKRGSSGYYLDRVLAHELTHAVMAANIHYFYSLPMFIKEGMAELTHGTDDDRGDEITSLAMNPDSLLQALNINTLNGYYDSYAGGYMFLRYIAKQFSSDADSSSEMMSSPAMSGRLPEGISVNGSTLVASADFDGSSIDMTDYANVTRVNATALSDKLVVYGSTAGDVIRGSSGANKIFGGAGGDTIYGGSGADTIYGGDGADLIVGNAGDDSLYASYGRNTLTGGDGADVFVHDNGTDLITDYAAGDDRIKLAGSSIVSSSVEGDNVMLYTTDGAITVAGGKDHQLTVIDPDGNETTRVYSNETFIESPEEITADNWRDIFGATLKGGGSKLILKTPFSGTVDAANFSSKFKTVDASKTDGTVAIFGNDNKNTFKAGAGGSTLAGAGGNDKLYGGSGVDVFVYDGQGKDKIYNYSADDRIVISDGEIIKGKLSGKKVVLTFADKNTLTINKASGVELTITTADGATNTYLFDKQHKTLDAALVGSSAQSAADAYWFMPDDTDQRSELNEIVSTDAAIDLDYDQLTDMLTPSTNELTYAARHKKK
ncbi:MAG: calcium-binding protein, partial [Selenomonadaceae bacterium]|nr:calcium-binding protein [Selenomonadaceae bacterium]